MAGYCGKSMSWNAMEAYSRHEMPMSKWTKSALLEEVYRQIEESDMQVDYDLELLDKISAPVLRRELLYYLCNHHTGYKYRSTRFFAVDISPVLNWTEEDIKKLARRNRKVKQ